MSKSVIISDNYRTERDISMQLEAVHVTGLFGRFNYVIRLKTEDRITILTAPNGYGKTVLLNMLTNFFRRQFHRLSLSEFERLELRFLGGTGVRILRDYVNDAPEGKKARATLVFEALGKSNGLSWKWERRDDLRLETRSIERYIPTVTRVDVDRWIDDRTRQIYNYDDLIERFSELLPPEFLNRNELPEWLEKQVSSAQCYLIETQRLLQLEFEAEPSYPYRQSSRSRSVVEKNAEDLHQKIGEVLKKYANEAQKLDQTFPKRVIAEFGGSPPAENEIRSRLEELEAKRKELSEAGLITQSLADQITTYDNISQREIRILLSLYTKDTQIKLSIFDELYDKISLFQRIMESHLTFKRIAIDSRKGLRIVDDRAREVPLTSLSSGEQHELVMIYDLLFRVPENALILIDEPELSLHVAWQKKFIPDLEEIQKLRSLQVIIATHSPQIINDRWDLEIDLSGTSGHELN